MLKKLLFLSIVCMNMGILVAQEAPTYAQVFKSVLDYARTEERESQFATARRIFHYLATAKQGHAAYIPEDIREKADKSLKALEEMDERGKQYGALWKYGFFLQNQPDQRNDRSNSWKKGGQEQYRKDELQKAPHTPARDIETELGLPAGSLRIY